MISNLTCIQVVCHEASSKLKKKNNTSHKNVLGPFDRLSLNARTPLRNDLQNLQSTRYFPITIRLGVIVSHQPKTSGTVFSGKYPSNYHRFASSLIPPRSHGSHLPSLKLTAKAPENGWLEYFLGLPFGALCLFSGAMSC